ncbi:MAG TPA: ATP-dependent Clp protease proteolytic subunit, partial [Epsilonproteobacteria bacterium]|nr:ATP-dependent Clp protease proteolytic subunit [Campylobacterota bacterium]
IEIQAMHILNLKKRLYKILSTATGQSVKTIEKESDRDNYFESAEAIKFGLADKVLESITKKDV